MFTFSTLNKKIKITRARHLLKIIEGVVAKNSEGVDPVLSAADLKKLIGFKNKLNQFICQGAGQTLADGAVDISGVGRIISELDLYVEKIGLAAKYKILRELPL